MTLILSGTNGLSDVDGSAATPAVRGTDANTGIFFPAADTIAFSEGGTEAMRIDSSGYILGGYSSAFDMSPAGTGQYAGISASTSSPSNWKFGALSFSADATANGMLFVKSRSATVGTNTVVQSGDALGNIAWRGADGTNYINAALIQAFVDGTPGTNDMPSRLVFSTTADGSSTPVERMRLDSSGNLQFNSGYGSVATAYGCRAWVNFNGTGTVAIRASGNVTSITDNGTGDYTVNFTTAMPDANYSMPSSSANTGPTMSIASPQLAATPFTTTTARIETRNTASGSLLDCQFICVAFFR